MNVKIDSSLQKDLEAYAKEYGHTVEEVVNVFVQIKLEDHKLSNEELG